MSNENVVIDAAEVLDDLDIDAARENLEDEADRLISIAVEYLPAADRDNVVIDREGIIDAIRAEIA